MTALSILDLVRVTEIPTREARSTTRMISRSTDYLLTAYFAAQTFVTSNYPLIAGGLVQPTDVLGQNQFRPPHRFQPGQCAMGIVVQGPTGAIRSNFAPNSTVASSRLP